MGTEDYPRLISLAVHELRTPAGVVGGYLRMLQRDADPLNDRHRKLVEEAEKSCGRLVALITQLSDLAKLDDGSATMSRRPMDLFPLVAEVAESVHKDVDQTLRLKVEGPNAGARMAGDNDRLRAALAAIFHAVLREQLGPRTLVVDRRIAREAGRSSAVVVIADADSVQTAYDAPPASFDEKRGGVGLSLPIARRVIEAHGGRLWSPAFSDARAARGAALIELPLES